MGYRKLGNNFESLPQLDLEAKGEGTQTKVTFVSSRQWPSKLDPSKMVTSYTVVHEGERKFFNGATVINRILAEAKEGDELVITFLGTQPNKTKGMNPVKLFEVVVDDPNYEGDDREETPEKKKDVPF